MEILNFGDNSSSRKKRSNRAILAVAALVVGVVGSTFAANISINNAPVEYGQGVAQTTACDSSVTVAPTNVFSNTSGSGTFKLSQVDIYDTTTSTTSNGLAACASKYLKVTAYGDSASTILFQCDVSLGAFASGSVGFSSAALSGGSCATAAGSSVAVSTIDGNSNSYKDGIRLAITSPTQDASGIYKFTLESHV